MDNKQTAFKSFSDPEVSAFCGQLALILKSGISSLEGISIMLEDTSAPEEKAILENILETLTQTGNLSQALEESGLFPAYMLHMTQIGEETGTLDSVMAALSTHYDREASIRRTIRSAVTYPAIMAGMMIIVILILLIRVLPIFNQVFIQLGTEMTGASRVLMNVGSTISNYSVIFAALLVIFIALLLYGTRTEKGRRFFKRIGYRFRGTRAFYEAAAACRFASGMALTLSSGLNPERCLELTDSLNEDPFFQKKISDCREKVENGEDLAAALHESNIFTGLYSRMTSIGSRTGSMDQVMDQIAELYQTDIDNRINNSLAILEPALVIALSLIIGIILLSVMLPLMGIMSSI